MFEPLETVPPETVGMPAERLKKVDQLAVRYLDNKIYSGLVTFIARRGKVVHARAFGSLPFGPRILPTKTQ